MLLVAKDGDEMSVKIQDQVIDQIRSNTDIVDVISEYVQLSKNGRNYKGLCPFHNEKTPSFSVSADKQLYHCFGCKASGNVFNFVMDIEGISFLEAVAKLGSRLGIQIDLQENSMENKKDSYSSKEKKMIEAHEFAAQMYHHFLMNTKEGEKALQYLTNRGFTKEIIEKYNVGWALPDWSTLTNFLQSKGYSLEDMEQCGLVIKSEKNSQYFDRFRGRVMFPIHDDYGKIIAFSGRIIDQTENEPKYLNSPESPIFKKSEVLYNLHNARGIIRKKRQVILMEGFMDVISAGKADVNNAVASMGTSLTEQHIAKIRRISDRVLLCYDGDNAGLEATKRAADMLNNIKMKVEVALVPNQLDPDSYIEQFGPQDFVDQIIDKPHSYISFMMMYLRKNKNLQNENDKLQYIYEVLELLVGKSPIEQDLYIKQLVSETNVSQDAITTQFRKIEAKQLKEFNRPKSPQQAFYEEQAPVTQRTLSATERAENLLLSHMLHNHEIVTRIFNSDLPNPFIRDEYQAVFIKLIGFYEGDLDGDYQRFIEQLNEADLRSIVLEAAITERANENVDEEVNDCIRQLKKARIELEMMKLTNEMKEAEKTNKLKEALSLSHQIIQLKKQLSGI